MKILEFQVHINPDHTVKVPPEIAAQIQQEQPIQVLFLIPESTEDQDWAHLTAEQFLKGYAESDAIYDELPTG
ncbi:hypothetical protein HYR99_35270 [Candidatus Poribacteria bacterium]|nr:hypothetical protein [Candidatus Poribacteria bacterium]